MSINQINIKPNKHKVYQCPKSKKPALLNYLLEQNKNSSIVLISSNTENLKLEGITPLNDEELAASPNSYELIISYDLPSDAEIYIKRVQKATQSAFILLDIEEQKELYPIETMLGRVIKQESIKGFEYEYEVEKKPFNKDKKFDNKKQDTKKRPFAKSSYNNPKQKQDGEKKPFDKSKNFKKDDKPKKWDKSKQNDVKPKKEPKENQKESKEIKPIRKIVIKKPKA